MKQCPFCGGDARLVEHKFYGLESTYGIECTKCKTQSFQFYETKEEAEHNCDQRKGDGNR